MNGNLKGNPVKQLVVFSDDWGRHPSSCQHLVKQLMVDHEVFWVNTIGTRSPRLNLATFKRFIGKLKQWCRRGQPTDSQPNCHQEQVQHAPLVLNPLMWPWFRTRFDRWLNRRLLTRAINKALADAPRPRAAITTIPLTADLVGSLDVDIWIYYCVDDLASWPGLDAKPLQQMESDLLQHVDAVVSVSDNLQGRLESLGRTSTLISHGVELAHWSGNNAGPFVDQLLQGAVDPLIVFWGLIDDRLQSNWVLALAEQLEKGVIILAGPIESLPDALRNHPNVRAVGPVPYDQLPDLASRAAVLIMPYRDITATRAMQPLKLKEYLATGLPCIVRRLPATETWADSLDQVDSQEEFVETTINRLAVGLPPAQANSRLGLVDESWDAKANALREVLSLINKVS